MAGTGRVTPLLGRCDHLTPLHHPGNQQIIYRCVYLSTDILRCQSGAWYRDVCLCMNANVYVRDILGEHVSNCSLFILEIAVINSYTSLPNSIKLKIPISDREKQSADKIRITDNKWVPVPRLWVYLKASSWQTMGQYLLFPVYYPKRQHLI